MKHPLVTKGYYSVHEKTGYRFNRPLFFAWAGLLAVLLALAFSWYLNNGTLYVNCPGENSRPCENPLFQQCEELARTHNPVALCEEEFLSPGFTLGTKPPFIFSNLGLLFGLTLMIILVINHYAFNNDIEGLHL